MVSKAAQLAQTTTIHGVPDFLNSSSTVARLFWGAVLIAAFGGAGYEIYQVIQGYLSSPLVTVFEIIPVTRLQFPTLRICPTHQFNATKVAELGVHPVILTYVVSGITDTWRIMTRGMTEPLNQPLSVTSPYSTDPIGYIIATSSSQSEALFKMTAALQSLDAYTNASQVQDLYLGKKMQLDYQYEMFMRSVGLGGQNRTFVRTETGLDVENMIDKLAMDAKQIIVRCQFMLAEVDCHQYMRNVFDIQFGRCFVIDPVEMYQANPGIGIQIFIDINTESAYKLLPATADGVYMSLTENYNPTQWRTLLAPVGSQTMVSLKATRYEFKTARNIKNCIHDHEYPETLLTSYPTSNSACRAECIYQTLNRSCGCTTIIPQEFLKDNSLKMCTEKTEQVCVFSIGQTFIEDEVAQECTAKCKPRCQIWEYSTLLSYTDFPSATFEEAYRNFSNSGVERWRKNVILLDISFQDIQYTRIRQEESATIDQLGSQIGGYLGLFAGASLISVIQGIVICLFGDCAKRKASIDDQLAPEALYGPRRGTTSTVFEKDGRNSREPPIYSYTDPDIRPQFY